MPDSPNSYILQGGDPGAHRLALLARVTWPTTRLLLRGAGIRRGMDCLDVGCGIGAVSRELARIVGPTGSVLGIDADPSMVDYSRRLTRRRSNLTFRQGRVEDLTGESRFDLVYARFILSHLQDPARAIDRLVRTLRPGGVLIAEDVDFPGHFTYPGCPAFDRYVELYQAAAVLNGADPVLGPRLPGLLLNAGLDDVGVGMALPTFREGEGKDVARLTLLGIAPALESAGLATAAEIGRLVVELDAFAADPSTLMSIARIGQAWGRKR